MHLSKDELLLRTAKVMQRNHIVLTCVYGLFVVVMRCITYVAFYNAQLPHGCLWRFLLIVHPYGGITNQNLVVLRSVATASPTNVAFDGAGRRAAYLTESVTGSILRAPMSSSGCLFYRASAKAW